MLNVHSQSYVESFDMNPLVACDAQKPRYKAQSYT